MGLDTRSKEPESLYAGLEAEYEEVAQRNSQYTSISK